MRLGKTLLSVAEQKANLLHSCPICSSLGGESLTAIAEVATQRLFEPNEPLATEGEDCTGFYLVVSGKVRVFKTSPSGREKVLLVAEDGMTFGEAALFGSGKFLLNAVALLPTRTLFIPRTEFLNMLKKNPDLALQVMESLCLWIRRLSSSVSNIAFLGARDKVVRYLLNLSKISGDRSSVELPDKKKDIADQLGITPETLSRVLHELEEKSLIKSDKRSVKLLDPEALEEASYEG